MATVSGAQYAPAGGSVVYPNISDWLEYCDRHQHRRGEGFSNHIQAFEQEGYRRINQLTGKRMTVEKLSEWVHIGTGTADLLIQYAEEDVELIKRGVFSMSLPDSDDPPAPEL
jgi:hypothetical protein